jgi:hypothetical protein
MPPSKSVAFKLLSYRQPLDLVFEGITILATRSGAVSSTALYDDQPGAVPDALGPELPSVARGYSRLIR